jgi:hypothetical protein
MVILGLKRLLRVEKEKNWGRGAGRGGQLRCYNRCSEKRC